jgi:hypothetical protein
MATLVLGAAGTALGGSIGGSVLGLSAATIGGMIGSTVGVVDDSWIISQLAPAQRVEGQRLDQLQITSAAEGGVIPATLRAHADRRQHLLGDRLQRDDRHRADARWRQGRRRAAGDVHHLCQEGGIDAGGEFRTLVSMVWLGRPAREGCESRKWREENPHCYIFSFCPSGVANGLSLSRCRPHSCRSLLRVKCPKLFIRPGGVCVPSWFMQRAVSAKRRRGHRLGVRSAG